MDMYKIAEVFKIFSNDTLLDPVDKEKMILDPSIYIHRYCDKLEFPDEQVVKKVRDIVAKSDMYVTMRREWRTSE